MQTTYTEKVLKHDGRDLPRLVAGKMEKKGEADRKIHYKSLPVALESPAGTHRLFPFFNICAPLFLGASNYFFLLLKKRRYNVTKEIRLSNVGVKQNLTTKLLIL